MQQDHSIKICDHTKMARWKKYIYYPLTLFGNVILNKIPSRHIRRWFYLLMGTRMGKKTYFFRRVEVLFPKGIHIGDYCTVGWFTLLDARGGIKIGNNVSIASYVKLITGSHDLQSKTHQALFRPIEIGDYAWICTGATILQGVKIGEGAVVASNAVCTKDIPPYTVWGGVPAKCIGERTKDLEYYPITELLH